ncbi:MAG: hypothetical protein KJZ69_19395 [Phycisphaerales bacterium]|nr:hypothetical protein [Phycisphaerales bacterium]
MTTLPDENLVAIEDACPRCAERCIDRLVWIEGGQRVRCATCLNVYTPPNRRAEGGDAHAATTQ